MGNDIIDSQGNIDGKVDEKIIYTREFQDRLKFLAKAWGGPRYKSIEFTTQDDMKRTPAQYFTDSNKEVFASNIKQGIIRVPSTIDINSLFGKDTPEDVWRVIRYLLWHEDQHLQHTPKNHQATCENKSILPKIYNAMEDLRAERMGFRRYKGMEKERNFMASAMKIGLTNMLIQLDKASGKESFDGQGMHPLTAFLMGLLIKAYTGDYGPLTPVSEGGKYEYKDEFLNKMDFDTIDDMLDMFDKSNPNSQTSAFQMAQAISSYATRRWQIDKRPPSDQDNNDVKGWMNKASLTGASALYDMKQQQQQQQQQQQGQNQPQPSMEDILNSMGIDPEDVKDNESVKREMSQIRYDAERKIGNVKGIEKIFGLEEWDNYRDEGMINHMIASLREWKVGWKEVVGEYGSSIDVEKMIINELNNSPIDDIYRSRRRLTPKDYVAILLDTSGSMSGDIELYKKALISITEALDFLGTHYALYVFNDMMDSGTSQMDNKEELGLYGVTGVVKSFDDKMMSDRNKSIVAGLRGMGGTPMGTSIFEFMNTKDFKKTKHMLILTDGGATDGDAFERALESMNKQRLGYHFIGIEDDQRSVSRGLYSSYHSWNDKGLLPMNRFTTTTVSKLPRVVVNILLGRRTI